MASTRFFKTLVSILYASLLVSAVELTSSEDLSEAHPYLSRCTLTHFLASRTNLNSNQKKIIDLVYKNKGEAFCYEHLNIAKCTVSAFIDLRISLFLNHSFVDCDVDQESVSD